MKIHLYFIVGYECDCFLKANKIFRDNNTYINFEKMKFDITIGKAEIHLENLFNGDPILGMYKFPFYFLICFCFKKFSVNNRASDMHCIAIDIFLLI